MSNLNFAAAFESLTGNAPFPWQSRLYLEWLVHGRIPAVANLPTGVGKTSVVAIWLIALANNPRLIPRRLVYVVNRRTVVDQTTVEVEKLRQRICECSELQDFTEKYGDLAISTLRGQFADNREWSADPSCPAVVVCTVDMAGSRLLFSGYRIGFKTRPLHAGFLGQDALLIHDEAHLEPAFQDLLNAIQQEQRCSNDLKGIRVMELSATARGEGETFLLNSDDQSHPVVNRRINATKELDLHRLDDEKKLAEAIVAQAKKHESSNAPVLIYARRVEDVQKIVAKLPKGKSRSLTGTIRGLERDNITDPRKEGACPVFARFLNPPPDDCDESEKWKVVPQEGTVYLVCTSAGEVGINISAQHLVCDLTTFDSMAQRFGRVNRFGEHSDTQIDILYSLPEEVKSEYDQQRQKTLKLLEQLDNASPTAIDSLPAIDRVAAFAPAPLTLPVSDILFDSWAMTTLREPLPGRPPVEPYLHGLSPSIPETHVAWRTEVDKIREEQLELYKPEGLLEAYPLKPHELLRDISSRVLKQLKALKVPPTTPVWLVGNDNSVEVLTLAVLLEKKAEEIHYKTVLLPPMAGGLTNGMLDGKSDTADDVADKWFNENGEPRRCRTEGEPPGGMRLIQQINLSSEEAEEPTIWAWYERPKGADGIGSRSSTKPVLWQTHTDDVVDGIGTILDNLELPEEIKHALRIAARFHDLGKKRILWQKSIGNNDPEKMLGKSGQTMKPRNITAYRHELGSQLDIQQEADFQQLSEEMRELVLHVIAVHHGYGRPHFTRKQSFDPSYPDQKAMETALSVPQRFARLQRKYGRWGLAYLESLLRAADYAASTSPSKEEEE